MNNSPEFTSNEKETNSEILRPSIERIERQRPNEEIKNELSPEKQEANLENARIEATEKAISSEKMSKKTERESKKAPHIILSKERLNKSYKQTLEHVQTEMPAINKTFSKVIHNKAVEKTSEVVGSTIARPNAILIGGICAFLCTVISYTIAKNNGYKLSGSETIISFLVGWLIGIIYDYLKLLSTGKKS